MLMRLTALLLFLFVSQNSQAAQIGKVFDGATVSCPPVEAVKPIAPETAMTATLNGQDLTVQINVCDGQQWKLDTSMTTHRYTTPDGKAVELRFAKFRLFVATANWAKHKFIELNGFETNPTATLSTQEFDLGTEFVDFSIVAEQTVVVDGVVIDVASTHWGTFRLTH